MSRAPLAKHTQSPAHAPNPLGDLMIRLLRHIPPQDSRRFSMTLSALACLPLPALAFSPGAAVGAGDIVFYTFLLTVAAFSAAIVTAYRQPKWLGYVVLTVLMALSTAAGDGMLAHVIGPSDFVLWALPFIILTGVTAYGYWLVSIRLESPHPLIRFRTPARWLAIASAILCMSSALWLKRIPLNLMWIPANLLYFIMLIAQTLPPLTWQTPDTRLRGLIRAFPFAVGGSAVAIYASHWLFFDFTPDTLVVVNRLLILLTVGFALTIVIWQAYAAEREKDAAQRRALEAAKAEAEMQLALARAEQDYERARQVASQHREQLASISHDLKQPIASLRIAIAQLKRDSEGPDANKLDRAVDYIDSLARAYLDELVSDAPGEDEDGGHIDGTKEAVSTLTFAAMIQQMFADDASSRGIDFKVVAHGATIRVDPLATMRAMTNLISNALAHAEATRIRVFFRRHEGGVRYLVMDNGRGMDASTLAAVLSDGVRGPSDSDGHGLGLGIVRALCEAQGMSFDIASATNRGTSAAIGIGA